MSYFKRVSDYRTYSGESFDFHFDYNANSGGGQAFLGGTFSDPAGAERHPKELEGQTVGLAFTYCSKDEQRVTVDLSNDAKVNYPINPRAAGSSQMKLGMADKVRPSLVYPALLALPATCGVNMAESLYVSPLTQNNYWLRSMWLELKNGHTMPLLVPRDFVFGGGSSKKGTQDKGVNGETEFYCLDHNKRANDIIWAADHTAALPDELAEPLRSIAGVLRCDSPFSYNECNDWTTELMRVAARTWPEEYSGYSDPLPVILSKAQAENGGTPRTSVSTSHINEPRNLIFFGAPGTGKSYELNKLADEHFDDRHRTRVTFYPDYTYSQFVGCFKPITKYRNDADDPASRAESYISYEFVPGPFLETYVKAVQNPKENFLLVVEEINRANPAAVFGDVFQLLDRDGGGRSVYEVAAPKEMRDYLRVFLSEYATNAHIAGPLELLYEQKRLENEANRLSLPGNMYIWATMNSADQGVFPMDTAFKRRWSFRYMGINEGESANVGGQALSEITVPCGGRDVVWNNLRRAINEFMASDGLRINEDKLLGPFFISPADLTPERFASTFKDKVLLYLYEDAGKTKRSKMFKKGLNTYSKVCDEFDEIGEGIFGEGFDGSGLVNEVIEADLAEE